MNSTFITLHQQYTKRINSLLANCMETIPPSILKEAMQYSLLAGGKRIRPFLVYATGQMFGCKIEDLDNPAAAIEAIHTYSLIHDDLPAMDNDELRRGMPTCHIKYGDANAILAGDALQTYAFSLLVDAPNLSEYCRLSLVKELALASGIMGMCLGQSLDLASEHKKVNLEELNQIHTHKTGALIKAAVYLGMHVAGPIAIQYEKQLAAYADAIGLAFQIQDDVLDVIGDKTIMGKNQGSDSQLEKSTYPSLLGLENAVKASHNLYTQALEALDEIPYNSEPLRQLADFIITRNS